MVVSVCEFRKELNCMPLFSTLSSLSNQSKFSPNRQSQSPLPPLSSLKFPSLSFFN